MIKKYILLSLGVALILTACKGSSGQTATGTKAGAETAMQEQNTDSNDTSTASESEASSENIPAASAPIEENSKAITREFTEYVPGTLTETGYESEWIGIRFTAPEGTSMIVQNGESNEMFCQDDAKTSNVIVMVEELPYNFQTVAQFVEQFEKEITADSTVTYKVLSDKDEVQLGSYIFRSVSFAASYNGSEMYQNYFLRIMGDKVVSIVITYSDASIETAEKLISAFEAY